MNWCDERYVRLYTRDTADWLALSFEAQGLLSLLIRKFDRSGVLELGKHGKRAVAIAVGHAHRWDVLGPALDELLTDGCVVLDGNRLVMPNFLEAQEAVQSDRMRQSESRARRREVTYKRVTNRDDESQNVTESHAASHAVTRGHAASQDVTPSVPSLPSLPNTYVQPKLDERVLELPIAKSRQRAFDLEEAYKVYPRHEGKKAGITRLEKAIKTPGDYEQLLGAIRNYARHVRDSGTPTRFVKLFSTFAGEWEDWVPGANGKPQNGAEPLATATPMAAGSFEAEKLKREMAALDRAALELGLIDAKGNRL